MAYGGDNRCITLKNCPCNTFLIESPEILYASSASAYDYYVRIHRVKRPDTFTNSLRGSFALYLGRIKIYLYIRVASVRDILYVVDYRTGLCSDDTDIECILRKRLFI